jgi:hypothetical protein
MNITTILVLFAGYLASFVPPLAWLCIAAAVTGALMYVFLFPQPKPVRKVARHRTQRSYTNATLSYHGRRWPTAVGCMA